MKKTILLLLMTLLPMVASADASGTCGDNLTWTYAESTGTLTFSGTGDMDNYSYPSMPWSSYSIKKVILEEGITSIGSDAFRLCSGLTSVTIPNSVTSIGEGAFYYCSSLTSVTIPNSVTSIGWSAFHDCSGLTSVTIPNSVTSIGNYAFQRCSGLTSITIPNSVTSIGSYAFSYCKKMDYVISEIGLPSNISDNVFQDISSNAVLQVPHGTKSKYETFTGWTKNFDKIIEKGESVNQDQLLYSIDVNGISYDLNTTKKTATVTYNQSGKNYSGEISIPFSIKYGGQTFAVTNIGSYAFYWCRSLTSVTIPNSVTSIGADAFSYCSGLTSVTIPNSVKSIGDYAFSGCSGLTSVTIGNSVTSIGDHAFYYCSGLTSVTIPNSVTSIGEGAFSSCSGLTSVTIGNSVTDIGNSAFSGCSGLTSVTIPNSVTSIGYYAFSGCSGLTSITIPNSVKSIGNDAFQNCSSLTSVTIPNSVTSIGYYAFSGCSGLTAVNVESGNIKYDSRENCNAIIETETNTLVTGCQNTIIPNSVTSIGDYAFYGCSGLTSVTIPNSVTSIGDYAFQGCNSLKTVYSEIVSPFAINENVFTTQTYAGTLHVPANTKAKYQQTYSWSKFANIVEQNPTTYSLTVTATGNGYATYNGAYIRNKTSSFNVNEGTSATITFMPDNSYYRIKSVKVNGLTVSLTNNQYTISSISANTTVSVEFEEIPPTIYTLSITATGNGSAAYNGTTVRGTTRTFDVTEGTTATITFTPDNGYRIKTVKVNGATVSVTNNQYTISSINASTTVEVTFVEIPSNFIDNGMNYAVTSFSGRQVMVTGGNYGIVLTVPATVTFQNETWKVAGIENGMLANNSQLAAVIWEPEAVFTAHVSNPNLLLYVKSAGYAPAGIRNVVVDGVANNIVLTDATNGNDFYCPQAFTASRISYTHNYSMTTGIGEAKGWESIALPFDVAKTVHASKGEMVPYQTWDGTDSKKPYWLMELGAGGFVNANAIKANTPYIISMPNHPNYREDYRLNGSVTFSAENVRVARTDDLSQASSGDKTFVPNFTNKQGTGVYALNVNSDYVTYTGGLVAGSRFVPNLRTLHPFEAYMTSTATTRMPIVIGDNMATGIAEVPAMMEETVVRVYLPSGQLVVAEKDKSLDEVKAQLPAGVYIVNGQKLIIK